MTAIYPYPSETSALSWYFYLCFALVLMLIAVVITQWKKNKTLVFGIGFFVVNILLVLQIVPTRNIIIADRYVYLPMLGVFFVLGFYFFRMMKTGAVARAVLTMLLLVWVTGFSMHSFNRNRVWETPETLWTDVVKKQPDALIAWYDLAGWYAEQNRHEDAIEAYLEVLRINPTYYNGLYNVANSYYRLGEYRVATAFYKKALDVRPGSKSAAMNIFMALVAQDRYDEARQVIQILEERYPGDPAVAAKKAFLPESSTTGEFSGQQLFSMAERAFRDGDLPEAIDLYGLAIEKLPAGHTLFYNRGNAYFIMGEFNRAIEDYTAALELNENFADCWYNRGMAFFSLGDRESFCNDMKRSAQLGNVKAAEKLKKECD
jgi:Flp pilus assembly protein TadD